ncbi:ZNF3 protein, partial [Panurus biarmicus]|nr:ZNF3 protein [Panurus biarmicus]
SFSDHSNLLSHQRLHSRKWPYQCGECHKSFSQTSHLLCHKNIHTGEWPQECSDCGK